MDRRAWAVTGLLGLLAVVFAGAAVAGGQKLTDANEREVMTPQTFRKLLNLQSGHGRYGRKGPSSDREAEGEFAEAQTSA